MQTATKTRLSFSVAALLLLAGCTQNQPATNNANANTTVSSTPPFQTKEPERYRATRTITITSASGVTVVTKRLLARDGEMRRDESETAGQTVVYLYLPEGNFLLLPAEKLFAPVDNTQTSSNQDDSQTSPDRLLHTETITTGYQPLGAETIDGKSVQKYRVVVNNAAGKNVSAGETFLWFDEKLSMPVRTESQSPDGTRTITELSNVELGVDKKLFAIPSDYSKIAFSELRGHLQKENQP
jgi:outer membrane lipoprotein-sorting protein